jgi:hypothetical protein
LYKNNIFEDKDHLLYEPGYVIPYVRNALGKFVSISHPSMNTGSMLKIEASNFLMMM